MSDHLIRRDVPIPKGTKIELHVTTVYEITLNDDVFVDGQTEETLAEIEEGFGRGFTFAVAEVERNYEPISKDGDWFLPNLLPQDWRTFRFERSLAEREHIMAGNTWRYVNLDEVLLEVAK